VYIFLGLSSTVFFILIYSQKIIKKLPEQAKINGSYKLNWRTVKNVKNSDLTPFGALVRPPLVAPSVLFYLD
jgi:hypothetical protein